MAQIRIRIKRTRALDGDTISLPVGGAGRTWVPLGSVFVSIDLDREVAHVAYETETGIKWGDLTRADGELLARLGVRAQIVGPPTTSGIRSVPARCRALRTIRIDGARYATMPSFSALVRERPSTSGASRTRCAYVERASRRSALLAPAAASDSFFRWKFSRREAIMDATAQTAHYAASAS